MKTRYKIIVVGIVLAITIFGTHQSLMYQCGTLPMYMETPKNPNLWHCLEVWENQSMPPPINLSAEKDSGWITGEDYCHEWCDNDELYRLGCDQPILAHLTKHSNLLDEDFDGSFYIDFIGLPDGVSTEKFEWCMDFIYDKRLPSEEDLGIELDHWENICSGEVPQCFATFDNGTEVRIQCPEYPWKCGIVNFDVDNYAEVKNEN